MIYNKSILFTKLGDAEGSVIRTTVDNLTYNAYDVDIAVLHIYWEVEDILQVEIYNSTYFVFLVLHQLWN